MPAAQKTESLKEVRGQGELRQAQLPGNPELKEEIWLDTQVLSAGFADVKT